MTLRLCILLGLLLSGALQAAPYGFAINSDDAADADQLLRIDLETGATEFIGPLPEIFEDVEGLAISAAGDLFAADGSSNSLLIINAETGAAGVPSGGLGNLGFQTPQDFGLSFTCSGELLLVSETSSSLFSVDVESGAATLIGSTGVRLTGLTARGDEIYGVGDETNPGIYRVDPTSGASELLFALSIPSGDAGFDLDADGIFWLIVDGSVIDGMAPANPVSRIYRIDPQSGAVTETGTTRSGIESLAIIAPQDCPGSLQEPESVPMLHSVGQLLLLLGFALLGSLATQRRREV